MKASVLLLMFLSLSLLYPKIVAAQAGIDINQQYDVLRLIIQMLWGDFPTPEAYTLKGFLQYVIFPFIALFAIMYGILSEIRIFRTPGGRKAQILISLMSAFLGGWYGILQTKYLLMINAWVGSLAFGLLFIIGIVLWFYGRANELSIEYYKKAINKRYGDLKHMQELRVRIVTLENSLPAADNPKDVKDRIEKLMDELKSYEDHYKTSEVGH